MSTLSAATSAFTVSMLSAGGQSMRMTSKCIALRAASARRSLVSRPIGRREQAHLRGGEVLVRRQQREAGLLDRDERRGELALPQQHFAGARAELRLVDPAAHGGVALRIKVDEQHAPARGGERGCQIDRGGGLADAALLVRDGDDALHGATVYCTAAPAPAPTARLEPEASGHQRPAAAAPGARAPSGRPRRWWCGSRAGRARRSP